MSINVFFKYNNDYNIICLMLKKQIIVHNLIFSINLYIFYKEL